MDSERCRSALDKFGAFIMEHVRDRAYRQYNMLEEGRLKSPRILALQNAVAHLSEDHKKIVRECVWDAVDGVAHDLLAAFQESHDLDEGIEVFVDGVNVAKASDMLHGELFGPEGWIAKFSQYPNTQ